MVDKKQRSNIPNGIVMSSQVSYVMVNGKAVAFSEQKKIDVASGRTMSYKAHGKMMTDGKTVKETKTMKNKAAAAKFVEEAKRFVKTQKTNTVAKLKY